MTATTTTVIGTLNAGSMTRSHHCHDYNSRIRRKRCRPRSDNDTSRSVGSEWMSILAAFAMSAVTATAVARPPQSQSQRDHDHDHDHRRQRQRQQQRLQQRREQQQWESSSCPPSPFEGWMTAPPDCKTYYWCQDGKRGSLDYHCPEGQVFHVDLTKCEFSWGGGGDGCPGVEGVEGNETEAMNAVELDVGNITFVSNYSSTISDNNNNNNNNNNNYNNNYNNYNYNYTPAEITALQTDPDPAVSFLEGPKIYYASPSATSCLRSTPSVPAPSWMTDDHLFSLKQECCTKMYGWMDLDTCLGDGFVETNFRVVDPLAPTATSSTSGPTTTMTTSWTNGPTSTSSTSSTLTNATTTTTSEPTAAEEVETMTTTMTTTTTPHSSTTGPTSSPPSDMPSVSPSTVPSSAAPTEEPTFPPSTAAPTASPTEAPSASPVKIHFVVEKIGGGATLQSQSQSQSPYDGVGYPRDDDPFAGTMFGSGGHAAVFAGNVDDGGRPAPRPPSQPEQQSQPQSSEAIVTELILPVRADATVSQQRPDITFGNNPALAVDAGVAHGVEAYSNLYLERFDSLLKFDLELGAAGGDDDGKQLESVTLELFSLGSCSHGGILYLATSSSPFSSSYSSWDSDTVNWDNAPTASSNRDKVGAVGPVAWNEWYRVPLDTASFRSFLDDGTNADEVTIRIEASLESDDRCLYASMDYSDAAKAPRLVLEYRPLPPPTQSPTTTPITMTTIAQLPQQQSSFLLPPLPVDSLPPSATGDFLLLRAIDDTTLDMLHPTKPFGRLPHLTVRFDPLRHYVSDALIRFDLRTLQPPSPSSQTTLARRPPRSAILLLFAERSCSPAGAIAATTTVTTTITYSSGLDVVVETVGSWSQDHTTWANAPSTPRDVEVGTFGEVTENYWHGFDVVGAVEMALRAGKEEVTFRLRGVEDGGGGGDDGDGDSHDNDGEEGNVCRYSSIESGRAPKLLVAFG